MTQLTLETLEAWLWQSADILRGDIDSSDYKNYIFGLLFLKRANDVFFEEVDKLVADGWNYQDAIEDEDEHLFYLPQASWWKEITKHTENIGQAIDKALAGIEESNASLQGVMTAVYFGDKEKLGDSTLNRLLLHFNKYSLRNDHLYKQDILGDAYEYLIKMFADDAGKKGGEFYTPKQVVRLIVGLIKPEAGQTVYDPTCGSGGMLLESAHYVDEHNDRVGGQINITLKGQEKNLNTWSIAKINMILHGMQDADIRKGNTLSDPKHIKNGELESFDRVVANPPFSAKKWWEPIEKEVDLENVDGTKKKAPNYNNDVTDPHGRFSFGIPPRSYADLAFVQHMIASLKQNGRMGVVLPHGILFRGSSEGKIRQGLLSEDLIEAVIGLPPALFYGTGIPASILIVNKSKPENLKDKVIVIDASGEFKEGKNQNTLEQTHIDKIIHSFDQAWSKGEEIEKFMRLVPMTEITENGYNLNIARYIDTSEPEEQIDINATLQSITEVESQQAEIDQKLNNFLKELGYVG